MPLYEFECQCGKIYEELTPRFDTTGVYEGVSCPQCGSSQKTRVMSACAYNFSNPVGTDRWNSETSGHGYRFEYNKPNITRQREEAMKRSHMGTHPYNEIDDVSSGKHFGEIK